MALGSIPARARLRWVSLRMSHPLPRRRGPMAARGRVRCKPDGRPAGRNPGRHAIVQDAGVERRRGRELRVRRDQLIHLTRVGLLGELSAALVHELNLPLAAILANAQAGRRRLKGPARSASCGSWIGTMSWAPAQDDASRAAAARPRPHNVSFLMIYPVSKNIEGCDTRSRYRHRLLRTLV